MVSFIAGIIASLTPCTIVIIPILLYRFGITSDRSETAKWKEIGQLLLGFLLSLLATGLFLEFLSQGTLINAVRLVLSIVFIVTGTLQMTGRLKLQQVQSVTHPFVLGIVLPWTLSLSPCVLPYITVFVANGVLSSNTLIEFLLFGFGLLVPAVAVALLGERLMHQFRKFTSIIHQIEKISGVLIIATGVYVGLQIFALGDVEIIVSSALLLLMLLAAAWMTFVRNSQIRVANILIFASLFLIWATLTFHCKTFIDDNSHDGGVHYLVCEDRGECPECKRCAVLFGSAAALGTLGYIASGINFKIVRRKGRVSDTSKG